MVSGFFDKLLSLFDADRTVERVAEDPILTAELLLLFRMILVDGEVSESELAMFRRICKEAFGIEESAMEQVVEYLQDVGYETSIAQSLALFRKLDRERKLVLARHMVAVAKADTQLRQTEMQLLDRTFKLLEIDPREVLTDGADTV